MKSQNDTCLGSETTVDSPNKPHGKINRKSDLTFVRYGPAKPIYQKGYDSKEICFHTPPARWGFYAFVYPYIERFLLGSGCFVRHRMEWVKDKQGNKIPTRITVDSKEVENPVAIEYTGKYDWTSGDIVDYVKGVFSVRENPDSKDHYLCRYIDPKYLKHKGDIWHHLDVEYWEIIARRGYWVKTSYDSYKDALSREVQRMKAFKNRTGYRYCIDHLEVFIEG